MAYISRESQYSNEETRPMANRAHCTECRWAFQAESHEEVADALERHARKEQHHVNFLRANVA